VKDQRPLAAISRTIFSRRGISARIAACYSPALVNRLNREFVGPINIPEVHERLTNIGAEVVDDDRHPDALGKPRRDDTCHGVGGPPGALGTMNLTGCVMQRPSGLHGAVCAKTAEPETSAIAASTAGA